MAVVGGWGSGGWSLGLNVRISKNQVKVVFVGLLVADGLICACPASSPGAASSPPKARTYFPESAATDRFPISDVWKSGKTV